MMRVSWILLVGVGPDVEVARGRAGLGLPRALEPRMLVGGVVDHQLGDDAHAALVRGGDEVLHVGHRAVLGMDVAVVGDVVAVVAPRRGIERQQPDRVDAEIGDVVELGDQAGEVADAVVVGIEERLHVQLVDDRVLVPELVGGQHAGEFGRGRVHGRVPSSGKRRHSAKGDCAGIEPQPLPLAVQREALAGHQVLDRERGVVGQLPFPQRDLEAGLLRLVRIEADDREHHVLVARQRLAVDEHLVVARVVEAHAEMAVQRGIGLADAVEPRDLAHDVAGRVEVPDADLVLLRVEIFLAARAAARASQSSKPE